MGLGAGRAVLAGNSQHRQEPGRERAQVHARRDETRRDGARGWRPERDLSWGRESGNAREPVKACEWRRKVTTGNFLSVAKVPAHVCMYF